MSVEGTHAQWQGFREVTDAEVHRAYRAYRSAQMGVALSEADYEATISRRGLDWMRAALVAAREVRS